MFNDLRSSLRTLIVAALPHHSQTEVLREAQSLSEMIDTLEQETTRIQQHVEDFAHHFAPPSEQSAPTPPPLFPPVANAVINPEQMEDIRYAFGHGATIAELAERYNVKHAMIFQIVHVPGEKATAPEPELVANGNSTTRRGRPPKSRD